MFTTFDTKHNYDDDKTETPQRWLGAVIRYEKHNTTLETKHWDIKERNGMKEKVWLDENKGKLNIDLQHVTNQNEICN